MHAQATFISMSEIYKSINELDHAPDNKDSFSFGLRNLSQRFRLHTVLRGTTKKSHNERTEILLEASAMVQLGRLFVRYMTKNTFYF